MSLHLHIDRLILDGLPYDTADASAIQRAVEAELSALVSEPTKQLCVRFGLSLSEVQGDAIQLHPNLRPAQTGKQIAKAVHSALRYSTFVGFAERGREVRRHEWLSSPSARERSKGSLG
jgi:hypothetical protein